MKKTNRHFAATVVLVGIAIPATAAEIPDEQYVLEMPADSPEVISNLRLVSKWFRRIPNKYQLSVGKNR